jgi:hypothetical protein
VTPRSTCSARRVSAAHLSSANGRISSSRCANSSRARVTEHFGSRSRVEKSDARVPMSESSFCGLTRETRL